MTTATMRLIERVERLEATGEIGDGTVAQLHELASLARYEQVGGQPECDGHCSGSQPYGCGKRNCRFAPLKRVPDIPRVSNRPCGAYACGDQMLCACGLAWDIDDPDPPGCPRGGR